MLIDENPENLITSEIALKKFEVSVNKVESLIQKFKNKKSYSNKTNYENDPLINEILNELSEPSLELLTDYGFNDADYEEVFGSSDKEELKKEIASAGLMLYRLQTLTDNPEAKNLFAKGDAPDAVNCFLEATGIAAGVALVLACASTVPMGGNTAPACYWAAANFIRASIVVGIECGSDE